jgi:hypothetical protein
MYEARGVTIHTLRNQVKALRNKEGRWETFKKWFNKTFKR